MRYYVVSDVHGFYSQMIQSLNSVGFFDDKEPHKLIVCGDMFDRGKQARSMQEFMVSLLHNDELVFIRGNHEDLFVDLMDRFDYHSEMIKCGCSHHINNGTWDTALQLSGVSEEYALHNQDEFVKLARASPFFKELIPSSINYFETNNHVFVHGWIPCFTNNLKNHYRIGRTYEFNPDWRTAPDSDWETARWFNGMELSHFNKINDPAKTIVCGHWNTSYGHSNIENKCPEYGVNADFSPFYGSGIIAIDACTAYSGMVNCIVIDD